MTQKALALLGQLVEDARVFSPISQKGRLSRVWRFIFQCPVVFGAQPCLWWMVRSELDRVAGSLL